MLSKRSMSEEEVIREASLCQFENLQSDVISVGSCVLCGACEYVCPIDSIQINHRKPVSKKDCEDDCHACYFACPRTFVSNEIYPEDIDEKPLGNYLDIYCVKADSIKTYWDSDGFLIEHREGKKCICLLSAEEK